MPSQEVQEVQEASQTSSSERDNSVLSVFTGGTRDITWEEGKVFQDFLVQYLYLMTMDHSGTKPWFVWKEGTRFFICEELWVKKFLHFFSWCSCENKCPNCPAKGCGRAFFVHPSYLYKKKFDPTYIYQELLDKLTDVLKIGSS
eukprot:GHVP01007998.1.p1 GENE.GHVP01007998.1~~GHVP01007998.1.p1  ORF type:complete len:144 (-),score=20.48 GHVP01007998.1:239-670(-)